jgi:hypothetical protein
LADSRLNLAAVPLLDVPAKLVLVTSMGNIDAEPSCTRRRQAEGRERGEPEAHPSARVGVEPSDVVRTGLVEGSHRPLEPGTDHRSSRERGLEARLVAVAEGSTQRLRELLRTRLQLDDRVRAVTQ